MFLLIQRSVVRLVAISAVRWFLDSDSYTQTTVEKSVETPGILFWVYIGVQLTSVSTYYKADGHDRQIFLVTKAVAVSVALIRSL